VDLVVADVDAAVVHYYSVLVVVNLVELYPAETPFDAENALRPGLEYLVRQNHCVSGVGAPVGDVSFVVLINPVLLDVGTGRVHQQNALAVVAKNLVV